MRSLGRPLRLREERQRRGWSLFATAMRARIDPTSISLIERGLRPAYPGWRRRIAEAFGLPEEDLFRLADPTDAA